MIDNPFVGTARIALMEFWTHLKSPRLLILVVLFALLVFGASYGLSQSPGGGFTNQPSLTTHPAIRNESGVDHYLAIGWVADVRGVPRAGVNVSLSELNFSSVQGPYQQPPETFLGSQDTNATGFVVFDVGTSAPENITYLLRWGPQYLNSVTFPGGPPNATFTASVGSYGFSSPSGSESAATVHVLTTDGYPASGADISLDGIEQGHPDANGFLSVPLPEGQHTLNVSFRNYTGSNFVFGSNFGGPAFENGADAVLIGLVFTFMPLILPIVAIAVSFDAIARERAQGSLELLLTRRVRREGILVGKFLGAFASIALPVVAVLVGGIGILTVVSGRAPTAGFAAAVVGASLFLLAVYVLLMLLFSTLAKSVGTAVVFGVVVWLFFNILFSFITIFLLFAAALNPTTPEFYGTLVSVLLFDPNLVYQMLVSAAAPAAGGGNIGLVPTGYLSAASLVVAAILWIAVPLLLTILVFRRKAEG